MSLKGFRRLDRGEVSIFAAFVLVVILAGVGLFVQSFSPNAPQSQTAMRQSQVAASDAPAGTKSQCNAGEVHTVTETSGSSEKPQDKPVVCYIKDSSGAMVQNPATKSDASCKDSKPNACTVRYCPPDSLVKTAGTCIVIQCAAGDTGSGCLNKNLNAVLGSDTPVGAIAALSTQNPQNQIGVSLPAGANAVNGSGILSAALSPDGKQQVINQLAQQNSDLQSEINKYAGYSTACSGSNAATCDSTDVQGLQKLQQLQAQQALTQQQLQGLGSNAQILCSGGACTQTCPNGGTPPTCVPPGGCTTVGCSGAVPTGNGTGNSTFNGNGLSGLLSGLSRGLASSPTAPAAPAQACSTDPNAYAQQQQQYQQQLQQYNYQLQQYQYQQQYNQYGGYSSAAPPPQPTPCSPSTQGQCSLQPQQPAASTCTAGSWRPIYSGNCIVNWQCSNLGAQLSCSPTTADVGMSLAISYSCAQGTATGQGFTASSTSGTTTVQIAAPPAGANTATYGLTCTAGNQTSGAQCSVQVTQPSIVLVANPATVSSGQTSQLGWVTTGMQSCVISSPQDAGFTAQNASNTSVNGTAVTVAASSTTGYLLHCQTLAGGTKDATTTVTVQ